MRIDKLSLLNFRCFRQLDITFDEHITILVAPNGAGKMRYAWRCSPLFVALMPAST